MKWFVGAAAMVNNGSVEHCGRLYILGPSIFGEDTILTVLMNSGRFTCVLLWYVFYRRY